MDADALLSLTRAMRRLTLTTSDGRRVEARLIAYGDRTENGGVHQGIAPLLEFALAGMRASRAFAVVPIEFLRERTDSGIALGSGVQLHKGEVARLVAWVDEGPSAAGDVPIVVVCGDELEIGRACAALARMSFELVRTEKPRVAAAAVARGASLVVVAGDVPGLEVVVRAAAAADVPLLAVGDVGKGVAGAAGRRLGKLDQRSLDEAVADLLDLV